MDRFAAWVTSLNDFAYFGLLVFIYGVVFGALQMLPGGRPMTGGAAFFAAMAFVGIAALATGTRG